MHGRVKQTRTENIVFLLTECGNSWYSVNTDPMQRNGCICPKCGKIVQVIVPKIDMDEIFGVE